MLVEPSLRTSRCHAQELVLTTCRSWVCRKPHFTEKVQWLSTVPGRVSSTFRPGVLALDMPLTWSSLPLLA